MLQLYIILYSLDNIEPIYNENMEVHITGSGSYGQIYLAIHFINKKYNPIKHMDKKIWFSQFHSLDSIQKEIDIQSRIDHSNIVKLLYVKETHLNYDLVMEYATNGNLFHYIRKYKGLKENNVIKLCDFCWYAKLEVHQREKFCGNTEYMSPELVNHKRYLKEIDVSSLDILLYEWNDSWIFSF